MTLNHGEEFKIKATPSPELARKLVYLAAQDNDSVLTGLKSTQNGHRGGEADRKSREALQLARLADPGYQALSATINGKLDAMDEGSVHALQEIEQELTELRKAREKMLEQAYRDEQGRRIFMTKDESAAYYEDGSTLEDDEFAQVKHRLRGKPTWEDLQGTFEQEDALEAERGQIHKHDAERQGLRDDLAEGAISEEEATEREQEIEQSMPERVRRSYKAPEATQAEDNAAPPDAELSADELAALDARTEPAAAPATTPLNPGAPSR